jgi:Ca-activated chloride channel family protein
MKGTVPAACFVVCLVMAGQNQPVFRTGVDAVTVDVSVHDGRNPVQGLSVSDFEIRDNGVPQKLLDVSRDTAPIDLSLLVDFSASLTFATYTLPGFFVGDHAKWLDEGVRGMVSLLRQGDRLQPLQLASNVRQVALPYVVNRQGDRRSHNRLERTSLFDAVVAGLMQPTEAGRRRLIVVLTDGVDSSSVLDYTVRADIMDRSEGVVHLVAVEQKTGVRMIVSDLVHRISGEPGDYDWILRDIATRTGGRFYSLGAEEPPASRLREALEEFRTRYVLRYIPAGVERSGWHDLVVTTPGKRYQIHARRGYFVH